jgi:hypothetical protein
MVSSAKRRDFVGKPICWRTRLLTVFEAKEIAKGWINRDAIDLPGFVGAYLTGSLTWMEDTEPYSICSDVDIKVVIDGTALPKDRGKFPYDGVILEVGYASLQSLLETEVILGDYHRANEFRKPTALVDPEGTLTKIQTDIGSRFAERPWVLMRCQHAKLRVKNWLDGTKSRVSLHDRVTSVFFAAGVTTHILLVANLSNPTVRRRYASCYELLKGRDEMDLHCRLLSTLGSRDLTRDQVMDHMNDVGNAFDQACYLLTSPYKFAADMTAQTRSIAIGGSLEMIDEGRHCEAMFWILAVYSRSRAVISIDGAKEDLPNFDKGYWRVLRSLGIESESDLQKRAAQIRSDLEPVWRTAINIVGSIPQN